MYKVAIIGAENSHCRHFASLLSPCRSNGNNKEKIFPDVELIGICGDRDACAEAAKECSCPFFTDDYTAFVGKVDCVMITARHGGTHLEYARPYIEAGCAIWMDKPITASVADAYELLKLVKENGTLICGGSSLASAEGTLQMADYVRVNEQTVSGGHVTAPVNLVNEYGNFWFYSQHLVQMITTVFGQSIISVEARMSNDGVHALYHYPKYDVSAYFGAGYSITVYNGNYGAKSIAVNLPENYCVPELWHMYKMITEKITPQAPEEMVYPVFVIEATIRALNSGKCERVQAV